MITLSSGAATDGTAIASSVAAATTDSAIVAVCIAAAATESFAGSAPLSSNIFTFLEFRVDAPSEAPTLLLSSFRFSSPDVLGDLVLLLELRLRLTIGDFCVAGHGHAGSLRTPFASRTISIAQSSFGNPAVLTAALAFIAAAAGGIATHPFGCAGIAPPPWLFSWNQNGGSNGLLGTAVYIWLELAPPLELEPAGTGGGARTGRGGTWPLDLAGTGIGTGIGPWMWLPEDFASHPTTDGSG